MSTLETALAELRDHERRLARLLADTAARHRAEAEVHHVARDLAAWSERHVREITDVAARAGLTLHPVAASEAVDDTTPDGDDAVSAGLVLLRDLRTVHLRAAEVSVGWVMIAQAAQASEDDDLLGLAQRCHPDTLRQLRWANAFVKQASAQILLS